MKVSVILASVCVVLGALVVWGGRMAVSAVSKTVTTGSSSSTTISYTDGITSTTDVIQGGAGASVHENRSVRIPRGATLVVEDDIGDVQVTGSAGESLHVDAEKHAGSLALARAMRYSLDTQGGTTRISFHLAPGKHTNEYMNFKIGAPADSRLIVKDESGDLQASGILGGLQFEDSSGNVSLANVTGRSQVDTNSGDIRCDTIRGSASFKTGSGDIECCGIDGAVSGTTNSGNITVAGSLTGASDLSTGSGNVTAVINRGASLSVHASTSSGGIQDDFGLTESKEFDGGPATMDGRIGAGSGTLKLSTNSGDVRLEKA